MEKLLYYVWEYCLFDNRNLLTTKGEKIEIIDPGHRNSDSGPDFFNAKIRIGEKLWAGNVEIHETEYRKQADEGMRKKNVIG